jgi:hypothetical protein
MFIKRKTIEDLLARVAGLEYQVAMLENMHAVIEDVDSPRALKTLDTDAEWVSHGKVAWYRGRQLTRSEIFFRTMHPRLYREDRPFHTIDEEEAI